LKKNLDIGQIVNSKLENKYNDDFFDESKGWDMLVGKLPKKGFWDWGFTHANVYYVISAALLIIALFYVTKDHEESPKTTTTITTTKMEGPLANPNKDNDTPSKTNKTTALLSKKPAETNQTSSTGNLNISNDSVVDLEKHTRDPDVVPSPANTTETFEQTELNPPQKEIIAPEHTHEHPKQSNEIHKNKKDSITIAQPTQKKDTIRRRIKRFD
jgi:hypothetical protein